VRRMESLSKVQVTMVAAALGCVALLTALLLGTEAEGKKGKGGGARVTSTSQSAILEAGAIKVRGGKGKVIIRAVAGSKVLGKVASYSAKQGKPGKTKSARSAKVGNAPLSAKGKELLSGCLADGLSARTISRRDNGKKTSRNRYTPLDRDLGICSVGSENPIAKPYKGPAIDTANSERCDFLDPAVCLQPWPSDYFTVADGSTDTGRRLALDQRSMPRNKNGTPINNTDYLRADGFSPGNMIIVKVPEVQTQAAFDNSGIVPVNDLRKFDDDNQPVVVFDADTGERHPIWAEMDANPLVPGKSGDPANSNLIIRPAVNFEEGHRYIVVLRNLRDAQNQPVEPPLPFRVYRDRLITQQTAVESRRPHIESLISTLQSNGFSRSNLYMTWDFTVASEHSLTNRALSMRDDALLRLGDVAPGDPIDGDETGDDTPGDGVVDGAAPQFTISSTSDPDGPGGNILRQVDGQLTNVPCYLDAPGCPPVTSDFTFAPGADEPTLAPSSFADDADRPSTPPSTGVDFRCIIPNSVDAGTEVDQAKPGTYGHGLLGLYTQVGGQARLGNQQNSIWCATNWAGFSEDDINGISNSLVELSNFRQLVDRMQQGFVNFLYLGRALANPNGFNTDDAFKVDADDSATLDPDESVIDNSNLYFEGISQGAVMGGALTALSPDIKRSVLNVAGMNYANLLRRSVDFDEYAELPSVGLYAFYPNELERPLVLSMMQLLWDRGETNGYAHHITDDPLANTPEHQMLLQLAVGDHQVSNLTAEVEARTIGARVYKPALDPGRHWETNPFMQLPGIEFGSAPFDPYTGSALVYYDGGPVGYSNDGVGEAVVECSNNPASVVPLSNPCDGSGVMPTDEVPPRPQNGFGEDPHGYPRRSVDALQHIEDFLDPDGFILPCTDPGPVIRPCYANGFTGP
jgi:hypothetical protein